MWTKDTPSLEDRSSYILFSISSERRLSIRHTIDCGRLVDKLKFATFLRGLLPLRKRLLRSLLMVLASILRRDAGWCHPKTAYQPPIRRATWCICSNGFRPRRLEYYRTIEVRGRGLSGGMPI